MLKFVLTILVIVFAFSLGANAQSKPLKGPAYKNASASEKYRGSSTILVRGNQPKPKGPEAKNQKPWEIDKSDFKSINMDELKGKNTKGLNGPAYKNYKPGVNN